MIKKNKNELVFYKILYIFQFVENKIDYKWFTLYTIGLIIVTNAKEITVASHI